MGAEGWCVHAAESPAAFPSSTLDVDLQRRLGRVRAATTTRLTLSMGYPSPSRHVPGPSMASGVLRPYFGTVGARTGRTTRSAVAIEFDVPGRFVFTTVRGGGRRGAGDGAGPRLRRGPQRGDAGPPRVTVVGVWGRGPAAPPATALARWRGSSRRRRGLHGDCRRCRAPGPAAINTLVDVVVTATRGAVLGVD